MQLNSEQQKIVDCLEGIWLVDAGAGTGKTHALVERYLAILKKVQGNPNRILLTTFTRNAAENMRRRIIQRANHEQLAALLSAPILTFDSLCAKIVNDHGEDIPAIFGRKGSFQGARMIENDFLRKKIFQDFYRELSSQIPERFRLVSHSVGSSASLLSMIEKCLAAGIIPLSEGWSGTGLEKLRGDRGELEQQIWKLNQPLAGSKGLKQSIAIARIGKNTEYKYGLDHFADENLIYSDNKIVAFDETLLERFFANDDSSLIDFFHFVFLRYLDFMIKNKYTTFGLNMAFAFLLLLNHSSIRKSHHFDYIMTDEFQDTNELQLNITLLLLKESNLCVVGDWKQGIYGFRYASIENIKNFESKLKDSITLLQQVSEPVAIKSSKVEFAFFQANYRSSQKILEFSNFSMLVRTAKTEHGYAHEETINKTELTGLWQSLQVTPLQSVIDSDSTLSEIALLEAQEDEYAEVVQFIKTKVISKTQINEIDGTQILKRDLLYPDIAILCRTRAQCQNFYLAAVAAGVPAVIAEGQSFFHKPVVVLTLAWLKLLVKYNDKDAWAVLLDDSDLSHQEVLDLLGQDSFYEKIPQAIKDRWYKEKKKLTKFSDLYLWLGQLLKNRHLYDEEASAWLLWLQQLDLQLRPSLARLVATLEGAINENLKIEVERKSDKFMVIQTIHSAKGLEYPMVILAGVNRSSFPSKQGEREDLVFYPGLGLRNKKIYDVQNSFLHRNWRTDLILKEYARDDEEEKRLLYVAMTRAKTHFYLSYLGSKRSVFIDDLSHFAVNYFAAEDIGFITLAKVTDSLPADAFPVDEAATSEFRAHLLQQQNYRRLYNPHHIMKFRATEAGRGADFGNQLHKILFDYIRQLPKPLSLAGIEPEFHRDIRHAADFLQQYPQARFYPELECYLPLDSGRGFEGIIDLVIETANQIWVIDWKSDLGRGNQEEYRKQISIYFHAVKEARVMADKQIQCGLFWTNSGNLELLEPCSIEELRSWLPDNP